MAIADTSETEAVLRERIVERLESENARLRAQLAEAMGQRDEWERQCWSMAAAEVGKALLWFHLMAGLREMIDANAATSKTEGEHD